VHREIKKRTNKNSQISGRVAHPNCVASSALQAFATTTPTTPTPTPTPTTISTIFCSVFIAIYLLF